MMILRRPLQLDPLLLSKIVQHAPPADSPFFFDAKKTWKFEYEKPPRKGMQYEPLTKIFIMQ